MTDPFAYDINDAFYGPLGEYVRRTEETVEVDALTHLSQVITAAGTAIGRRAATRGGHSLHYANLYTLVIGDSGIGKGVSWELAAQLGEAIDPGFAKRTAYDVASAPGLIRLTSDGVYKPTRKRSREGEEQEYEIVFPPVHDKRLLLQIPEMMSVFTSKERDGSTLGEALHNAWDGRDLQNNAKDRMTATNPHISLVGHITPDDFAKAVADNRRDLRNGFFNRFILLRAHNVRVLPFYVPPPDCRDLFSKMRESLESLGPVAQSQPNMILDWHPSAREPWRAFYSAWRHNTHPFLRGMNGLQSRLAPVAMRVALNYAVFDGADAIYDRHLQAAKALVLPAYDGSRPLFGKPCPSSPNLAEVLRTKFSDRQGEWLATDLHESTGKKFHATDLTQAVDELLRAGVWQYREDKKGNGQFGRIYSHAGSPNALLASLNEDNTVANEEPVKNEAAATIEAPADAQLEDTLYADFDAADDTCEVRVIDGMEVECFSPFVITENRAAALRIGGGLSEGVRKGDHGFRIRSSRRSASDERSRVGRRLARDGYLAVVIGDRPLHLKRAFLRFETTAPTAA